MKAQDIVIDLVVNLLKIRFKSRIEPIGMLAGHLLAKYFTN